MANFKLTLKQRRWLKEYVECGNATEAASRVYACKNRDSANAIGAQNLAKISIDILLEESGVSDAKLVRTLMEGMDATKPLGRANIKVPDYHARHRFLVTALLLKNHLRNKREIMANEDQEDICFVVSKAPEPGETKLL